MHFTTSNVERCPCPVCRRLKESGGRNVGHRAHYVARHGHPCPQASVPPVQACRAQACACFRCANIYARALVCVCVFVLRACDSLSISTATLDSRAHPKRHIAVLVTVRFRNFPFPSNASIIFLNMSHSLKTPHGTSSLSSTLAMSPLMDHTLTTFEKKSAFDSVNTVCSLFCR